MLKFDKLLLEHALIRPCTIAQTVLVSLLKFNCEPIAHKIQSLLVKLDPTPDY